MRILINFSHLLSTVQMLIRALFWVFWLASILQVPVTANNCNLLANYKVDQDYQTFKSKLSSCLRGCEKPESKREFYDRLFKDCAKESLEFYLEGVCNHFPDLFFDLESTILREKDSLFKSFLGKSKDFTKEQQIHLSYLLRSCSLDVAREKLLPVLCPMFVKRFGHLDPGFSFACIRSVYINKTAFVQSILQSGKDISICFAQIFHEILFHFANFKLYHKEDCAKIVDQIHASYSSFCDDVRSEKFGISFFDRLVNRAGLSAELAYLVDKAKFFIVFSHLYLNDPSEKMKREIASYEEGVAFFKMHDFDFHTVHSTRNEFFGAFDQILKLAPDFQTPDTYMLIVALYERWDKGKPEREENSFSLSKVTDYLHKFSSKHFGRPNEICSIVLAHSEAGLPAEFANFKSVLQKNFHSTQTSVLQGEEVAYTNCFLVKEDNIDLILDWLHDKSTSKAYSFDKDFANAIYSVLVKIPSVMQHVLLAKKKYLHYFAPFLLEKGLFDFYDSAERKTHWPDVYLFQWLLQKGQTHSAKNEILSHYFEEIESCGVHLEKDSNPEAQVLYEDDLIYSYSTLKLDNLLKLIRFLNGIQEENTFAAVFDAMFVRKGVPEIMPQKISSSITKTTMLELGLFSEDECSMLTTSKADGPFRFTLDLKIRIAAYLTILPKLSVFRQGEIIGPADSERLDVLLHRIHFSDLALDSTLRKECEEFNDRLWNNYGRKQLRNMELL